MIRSSLVSDRRALVAALLLSSALATPALANDAAAAAADAAVVASDDGGAEITVTARHRDEKLEEVPLAITVIGGPQLAAEHLDRVSDYAFKVPNFSALQQNTRVSGLFIRGLGGNASNDGAEGGVALIVDNVVFTHVGFSWLDFVDLDSIQVVRGPQGTLLGKNTTIGAVIVNTAKPSFKPSLNVSATYGNNDLYQIRANATGPIIADKLAYRLTAATSQGGGWTTNAFNGVKLLNNNRWSVRGQLYYTPSSAVTDRLIVEHYETHEYNNFYPPIGDVNSNLKLDGTVYSARAASWTHKLANLFGYNNPNFNAPFNANLDSQGRLQAVVDGASNELNWDLGGPTLTSITAYRRLKFTPHNDSDMSPLPILNGGYNVDVKQYSQEVRVASKKGGFLDWQLGAYYLQEDLNSTNFTTFYADAAQFLGNNAGYPSAALNGVTYYKAGQLAVDSVAGFGQVTLNLTKRFTVTGGLRYTQERKAASVTGSSTGPTVSGGALAVRNAILNQLGGTASGGGVYQISDEANTGSLAWLVNPAFKVNDNVLLYASAGYGVKSGAANTAAGANQAGVVLIQPEKSLDYEAGIKTTWLNGRAVVNLNFYNDTITNYQDTQVDTGNPLLGTYLANVGKVRLRGLELETSFSPVKGATLYFNSAYNDAKYLAYGDAPAPIEYQSYLSQPSQENVAASATYLSLTGYQIRNAPKWVAQGGLNLEEPVGRNLLATGYIDASYRSTTALLNPRSVYGWQHAYTLINAGIGLKTEDKAWELQVWAKNLTNKRYATAFAAATANTPLLQVFGDPRTFGATLSHKF